MGRGILAVGLFLSVFHLEAAPPALPEFITQLVGCFRVSYRFVEAKHSYGVSGYELVTLAEDKGEYTLQHYGILEDPATKKKELMKHWYEQWKVDGPIWEQHVYGPSNNFRYHCKGKMQFNQIRCTYAGAPKPQRDMKRTDYLKLDRENTIQTNPKGYIHSEVNGKRDKDGKLVAVEVGWNEYRRVDNKLCEVEK